MHIEKTTNSNNLSLPLNGMSRDKDLLPFLPFGRTTLWKWSNNGLFPQAVKISEGVTAWKNEEVHEWLNSFDNNE